MKSRNIFLLLITILAVFILFFLSPQRKTSSQTLISSRNQTKIASATNNVPHLTNLNTTNGYSAKAKAETSNHPSLAARTKEEGMLGTLFNYNDVPIDFYGRVEDQFSNGVANAAINFNVRIYNGRESTVKRGQVLTDDKGNFAINGYRGESLALVSFKKGYVMATGDTLFKYSHLEEQPYVPDSSSPTVIKMWKLIGAEPLIGINKTFKIPYTSEPIYFDLLTGSVVSSGGDLVAFVYRTNGIITQRIHGDWGIKLVPVNGGIIEPEYNTSYVTFEAPETGYEKSFSAEMNHDSTKWFDNIQKAFFLKSRNGQVYSKFSLYFEINDDRNETMLFIFKGVANPNASRNWEASAQQ